MSDISKIKLGNENYDIKDVVARQNNATTNLNVEALRNKVNTLSDNVTLLNENGLIIIGDSYGVDTASGGKSWASYVEDIYPNCFRLTEGGTGFGSDVYLDKNWLSMLETADIQSKEAIKDIYVIGGANDGNLIFDGRLTINTLINRINSFCSYCSINYPNAVVHIGFIGWYLNRQRFPAYTNAKNAYRECALNNPNASYISGVEYIMHNNGFINPSDLIHPIQEASTLLGTVICNIINSKNDCVNVCFSTTPILTSDYQCTQYVLTCVFCGNVAILNVIGQSGEYTYMTVRLPSPTAFNYTTTLNIFKLSNIPTGGATPPNVHLNVYTGGASGAIETIPCLVQLQDGLIKLKNVSNNVMSDAQQFLIPSFQLVIPLENN